MSERPLLYSTLEMEAEIAKKNLTQQLGFHEIKTCEQAKRAAQALNDLDGDGQRPSSPRAPDGAAEPEEKMYRSVGPSPVIGTLNVIVDGFGCNGTLLNAGTAVVPASCVDHIAGLGPSNPNDARAAIVWTILELWRPATGKWQCLTGGPAAPDGRCYEMGLSTIWQFGPYWGSENSDSNIALLILTDSNPAAPNPTFHGVTTADFMRVYTGSFNNFSSYLYSGSGVIDPNSTLSNSIMRYSGFGNDGFGNYNFWSETRTPRLCKWEWGAPATITNIDVQTGLSYSNVIGHWSHAADGDYWGDCAGDDQKQFGTRMHTGTPGGSKIDWIQSKMWLERRETCVTKSGTVGNFRQCF